MKHKWKIIILLGIGILLLVTISHYKSFYPKNKEVQNIRIKAANNKNIPPTKVNIPKKNTNCKESTQLYENPAYPYFSFYYNPTFFTVKPSDYGFKVYSKTSDSPLAGAIYYRNIPNSEHYLTMRKDPEWKYYKNKTWRNKNNVLIMEYTADIYDSSFAGAIFENGNEDAVLDISFKLPMEDEEICFLKSLIETMTFKALEEN